MNKTIQWLPPRAQSIDEDSVALKTIFTTCEGEKWYIKIGWKTYDDRKKPFEFIYFSLFLFSEPNVFLYSISLVRGYCGARARTGS